jgi:hypothetical protein
VIPLLAHVSSLQFVSKNFRISHSQKSLDLELLKKLTSILSFFLQQKKERINLTMSGLTRFITGECLESPEIDLMINDIYLY